MTSDEILKLSPIIPVLTIDSAAIGVRLAAALAHGGIRVVEITLRTPQALATIRAIRDAAPDMIVGAGTVLSESDLHASREAGAAFAVSPGATPHLLTVAKKTGVPLLPGIATASDIMVGLEQGYSSFKFFPAENVGGIAALKALSAPFAAVRFCPTGGLTLQTAQNYLALPNVSCVGGSWVAPAALIARGEWAAIEALAKETLTALGVKR